VRSQRIDAVCGLGSFGGFSRMILGRRGGLVLQVNCVYLGLQLAIPHLEPQNIKGSMYLL
jgi:hypothetical protein